MKKYYKVSSNIANLRLRYGETQLELANAIGVSVSMIGMIEANSRKPARTVLMKIARHFNTTIDNLLYSDIPCGLVLNFDIKNSILNSLDFNLLFPLVDSEKANQFDSFRTAYQMHSELSQKQFFSEKDVESFEEVFSLYDECIDDEVSEAMVNSISLMMFFGLALNISMGDSFIDERLCDKLSYSELIKKLFTKDVPVKYDIDYEMPTHDIQLHDLANDLLDCILILSKTNEYPELVSFFSAERYLFGLVDNTLSNEMNSTIGSEMMAELARFGNQYARRIMLGIKKILEK